MRIIPAIDLLDGKVARLINGDYSKRIYYEKDPLELAQSYCEQGAELIHLVDLDGARTGSMKNIGVIKKISSQFPVQVGGGIRDAVTAEQLFSMGVSRIVVSSIAFDNGEVFSSICSRFPRRIVLSLDISEQKIMTSGWLDSAGSAASVLDGVNNDPRFKEIVVSDIRKDGTLGGADQDFFKRVVALLPNKKVIAAGGVSSVDDVLRLKGTGLSGAIVGRLLLEEKAQLRDLISAGGNQP